MATANRGVAPVPAASRHPLRNRNFRLLWMGNTVSWLGDGFYLVALPWLILQRTGSGAVLGTIMMMAAVPRASLMLAGGVVTDRLSPRKIMIATASSRTVLVAAIAVLIWLHSLQIWHLYVLACAFGIADAFAAPAAQAFLPSLVEPKQLAAANSMAQSTAQIATLVALGPAGLVVKGLGVAWAFLIDAISFLFIIAALWRLPDPPKNESTSARRNMWHSIVEGLQYVKRDVLLSSLLLVAAALNLCIGGPVSIGIPFLAKQKFGSPAAFGLLMSVLAAGSLTGMLAAGLSKPAKRGLLLLSASAVIGICTASLGLLNRLWSLAAVLFLMSATAGFVNVQLLSWFQQRVDRPMLGRVMSVLMFAAIGLAPVSLAVAGLAIKWSLQGMFAGAGLLVLTVATVALMQRTVREID